MLKARIIGVIVVKNGWVVQSINFKRYLPVGRLDIAVEYLDRWGIDEIVILDIDATRQGSSPNLDMIKSASSFSQTPLSVGGGIKSLKDMESLLRAGADKLIINSQLISNSALIEEGAHQFGNQCMVASIDAIKVGSSYNVFNSQAGFIDLSVENLAIKSEDLGAGEIFLNSVDRDGMKLGLDLNLGQTVRESLSIPLILCGGVGKPSDFVDGINAGFDAVAAGNFFHFTEMSVIAAKEFILQNECDIRFDSFANYSGVNFDKSLQRPTRLSEIELENLRFEYIPEETI